MGKRSHSRTFCSPLRPTSQLGWKIWFSGCSNLLSAGIKLPSSTNYLGRVSSRRETVRAKVGQRRGAEAQRRCRGRNSRPTKTSSPPSARSSGGLRGKKVKRVYASQEIQAGPPVALTNRQEGLGKGEFIFTSGSSGGGNAGKRGCGNCSSE